MTILRKTFFAALCLGALIIAGCNKGGYYTDSGREDPKFSGNTLDYLKSRPGYYDSLLKVIQIAGMEDVFKNDSITFFAPADSSIVNLIFQLNYTLERRGKPEVTDLAQLKPAFWREQLSKYIFKRRRFMDDYPQLDPQNISAFPGRLYASYEGKLMNIGVVYNDIQEVKYAGYREIMIASVSDAAPLDITLWARSFVATSNIETKNGVVHELRYVSHYFGFDVYDAQISALSKGVN